MVAVCDSLPGSSKVAVRVSLLPSPMVRSLPALTTGVTFVTCAVARTASLPRSSSVTVKLAA